MNRHPDRNRLRALDGVEPPDQWDEIVLRADTDLPRLQLQPARASHRLLVAAVLLVLAGVTGALVLSTATGDRGEFEAIAADGSAPSFPTGGEGAPGTAATTPDGLPVPTTAPVGDDADGGDDGTDPGPGGVTGGPGGSTGSGGSGGGHSGPGRGPRTTTTVAPRNTTSTTVVTTTTTTPSSPTTVTTPTEVAGGGQGPIGRPSSPIWGKRWQVLDMAQGGVSRTVASDAPLSVDARTDGEIVLTACNRTPATASIEGNRLSVTLGAASPGKSCGEALDGNEAFLVAFLGDDPLFAADGNRLVLTVGNRRVELTAY